MSQVEADPLPESTAKRPNIVRRMYDWVLGWAESPRGTWALFFISFAESSFFPIPPDPLLLALCLGKRARSFWYAFVCSLGSVLGGIAGYAIGSLLWGEEMESFFIKWIPGFTTEVMETFFANYKEHGFLIVFTAGFSPIPYKVFTLLSGVAGMNLGMFILASAVSRSARFFIEGVLIWRFGEPISGFIDRYFDKLAFLFVILLVGGLVAVKYIL